MRTALRKFPEPQAGSRNRESIRSDSDFTKSNMSSTIQAGVKTSPWSEIRCLDFTKFSEVPESSALSTEARYFRCDLRPSSFYGPPGGEGNPDRSPADCAATLSSPGNLNSCPIATTVPKPITSQVRVALETNQLMLRAT